MTKKIPEGFQTLTPYLTIDGAAKAIELYKKAFGAKELHRIDGPDGKVGHACLEIGTSKIFLGDVHPGCSQASNSSFYIYVDSVDDACVKAKKAGLEEKMPPQDMFWGDRMGSLKDSFGISWSIATHTRDVSEEELKEGAKKMGSKAA